MEHAGQSLLTYVRISFMQQLHVERGLQCLIQNSVARTGIEPATLALLAPRSNQLS